MDLNELENQVIDEESFMKFVEALAKDLDEENKQEKKNPSLSCSAGINGWENKNLSDFLQTMVIWADSSKNGMPYYEKPKNPWQRMANILSAAKIYE